MIAWESKYETGIESIDNQHMQLVAMISELSELVTSAVQGDDIYDEMMAMLESLTQYTVDHFKYEEALLEQFQYDELAAHKVEHEKLIAEIESLDLRSADEDQAAFGKKIMKSLISWLFKHISGTDFLYRDLLISKGVQ